MNPLSCFCNSNKLADRLCLYLQEGVNVSHCWDEVWDEGLQAVLQLCTLRGVAERRQQKTSFICALVLHPA